MVHNCLIPSLSYFHYALEFATQILAYMLDSLVRVSRRVAEDHFVNILDVGVTTRLQYYHNLQSVTAQKAAIARKNMQCQEHVAAPQSACWYLQ